MASPILWRLNDVSVCCWHRGDDGISGLLHILRSKITRTCWTGFVDLCKWISGTRWEVDFWRARLQISLSAGFWQIIGCGILGGGHKTQRPEISGGRRQRLYARTSPMVVWAAASLQSWSAFSIQHFIQIVSWRLVQESTNWMWEEDISLSSNHLFKREVGENG